MTDRSGGLRPLGNLLRTGGLIVLAVCSSVFAQAWGAPVIRIKGATYSVGLGKVDITPKYPIRLNGYYGRNVEATNAVHPLFAKALAIGTDKEGPAVLVGVDNCIVPKTVYDQVRARLEKRGVRPEKFAILVSHSHTAPKLAGAADNIFGMDIPAGEQAH